MAKSSSLTLPQWIFILLILWGAIYFAGVILRDRIDVGRPADPVPPEKATAAPEAAAIEWLPPIDEHEEPPRRSDFETLKKFRGKPVAEIIGEIRKADTVSAGGDDVEKIRLGEIASDIAPERFAPFPDRAAAAGIAFRAENELNGSSRFGLADLDGDGDRDLQLPANPDAAGLSLLENLGDGQFEAMTASGPFPAASQLAPADFDNDGDLDLFVMRFRLPNSLLENNGDGTFREITEMAGLLEIGWTASVRWVDFDRDGAIDLLVAGNPENYGSGEPSCRLFHNEKDGTFRDLGWETGLRFSAYVRDCAWGDLDGDGFPDLVVSTFEVPAEQTAGDSEKAPAPILLLRSVPAERPEHWRFEPITIAAGMGEIGGAGPIALRDFDQDGAIDLLAGGGTWNPFRLFRNDGSGRFEEVSGELGLDGLTGVLSMEMADLDGDGHQDLALGTADPSPNRVFLNRGGDTFREVTGTGGFGILQSTPALGAGDLDGDGDIDLVAAADWTGGAVFENPGTGENHWLALDLVGDTANRAAIGARVSLVVRDRDWILHRIERIARGPRVEIGLGDVMTIESLEIEWPVTGWPRSQFTEVPLNRLIRISEGDGEFTVLDRKPIRLGGGEAGDNDSGGS